MRLFKLVILIMLLGVCAGESWAQSKKSSYSKTRYNRYATKVPRNKARIICPIFEDTGYPYHGIGLKIGDPLALTYKFYPTSKFGFAVDFGKSASGLYNRYYREQFTTLINADTLSDNAEIEYLTHKVKSDWVGEIKAVYQIDAEKLSPGLQLYFGIGWEWRNTKIDYEYIYSQNDEPKFASFPRSRYTSGIQGVIGIEYSYFSLPISAFMEIELYNDITTDPGWRHPQGGIGIRYVFQ